MDVTPPAPPRSHPSEPTLLLFSAGRLGPAFRAAVAAHAAGCARCGALLREGEALGGALFADEPPAALARLDDPAPPR